jgi:ElaB/YqjD/DUF883 family membrane-anchored ribosome-binding protein
MDDFNNEKTPQPPYWQPENRVAGGSSSSSSSGSTGSAAAPVRKLSETAADVKDKVTDLGRRAVRGLDDSRETAAHAMDKTASSLHSGADQFSSATHSAASHLQSGADYVRQTNLRGMVSDVQDIIKRYPGQSLAAAAILGFLLARGLRSSD